MARNAPATRIAATSAVKPHELPELRVGAGVRGGAAGEAAAGCVGPATAGRPADEALIRDEATAAAILAVVNPRALSAVALSSGGAASVGL